MSRRDILPVISLIVFFTAVMFAVLVLSVPAKADPSTPVAVYAAQNAEVVCEVIADHPSIQGVTGVVSGVMEDANFTAYEAGQVVGLSVSAACPEMWPVLDRFIQYYSASPADTYVASGKVGGALR